MLAANRTRTIAWVLAIAVLLSANGIAQDVDYLDDPPEAPLPEEAASSPISEAANELADQDEPVALDLDEAIQIALTENRELQSTRLDVREANLQVTEARGAVFPQVELSSNLNRNLRTANPFAGTDFGTGGADLFGPTEWLAFNEQARLVPGEPEPIPLSEFEQRQQEGLREAGIDPSDGANPFVTPNQFDGGVTVSQTLYNASAFAAMRGAQRLRSISERGVEREERVLIHEVREAYYAALLAQDGVRVTEQAVERTERSVDDATRLVARGVAPITQQLGSEVELANLETELVEAQNQAELALDNLKNIMGIPVDTPIELSGSLERLAGDLDYERVDADLGFDRIGTGDAVPPDAVEEALQHRTDYEQAQLAIELNEIDRDITSGSLRPIVSAFADFGYTGQVPDNRAQSVQPDETDPFTFEERERGFFDGDFWESSISVGLSLQWNIFDGMQSRSEVAQRDVEVRQAEIDKEQLERGIRLEVQQALKTLQAAERRIISQERNLENAEVNYDHVQARLREGTARPIEEREASNQLDQSRLNHLQAVHDYVVALSELETALGRPIDSLEDLHFARR